MAGSVTVSAPSRGCVRAPSASDGPARDFATRTGPGQPREVKRTAPGKRRTMHRPHGRFDACAILRADPALALGALLVRANAANRAAQADDSKRARYFGRTPRWRLGL
jgi:hypothetical protein